MLVNMDLFFSVHRLKFLTMSHCELTSLSPHLFDLPCLEQLNVSYNMLTTLGLKDGKNQPNLCSAEFNLSVHTCHIMSFFCCFFITIYGHSIYITVLF